MELSSILQIISERAATDERYAKLNKELDKVFDKLDKIKGLELELNEHMDRLQRRDKQEILFSTYPKIFNFFIENQEMIRDAYDVYMQAHDIAKQDNDTVLLEKLDHLIMQAIGNFEKFAGDSVLLSKDIRAYLK